MQKINISKLISKLKKETKSDLNKKITQELTPKPYRERNMLDEEFYGKEVIKEGMYEGRN
jgi:hypothetical protein